MASLIVALVAWLNVVQARKTLENLRDLADVAGAAGRG